MKKTALWFVLLCGFAFGQETSVQHWTVDVDGAPHFSESHYTNAGNELVIRVKGAFACTAAPIITDASGPLHSTCKRNSKQRSTIAIYTDPFLLELPNYVSVQFREYARGMVYHLHFEEFGSPLLILGY